MTLELDRFYLIVDSADWIARMAPIGVRLFQLRIKDRVEEELRAEIRQASALCRRHGATLVINDYWQLAIEEGCDVLHLGQEDLAEADLPAIRRSGLRLGISTHDEAELEAALSARPDYVALGPIWPTILKAMPFQPQTPARLSVWRRRIGTLPLVAIGGLSVERAPDVFAAGADCAAVVTDVLLAPDPEDRARQWLRATRGFDVPTGS